MGEDLTADIRIEGVRSLSLSDATITAETAVTFAQLRNFDAGMEAVRAGQSRDPEAAVLALARHPAWDDGEGPVHREGATA